MYMDFAIKEQCQSGTKDNSDCGNTDNSCDEIVLNSKSPMYLLSYWQNLNAS